MDKKFAPNIGIVAIDNPHGSDWHVDDRQPIPEYHPDFIEFGYTKWIMYRSKEGYRADYMYTPKFNRWDLVAN